MYGEEHPGTIAGMKGLIYMFTTQGRLLHAEKLIHMLGIQTMFGPEHPHTHTHTEDTPADLAFIREQYKLSTAFR